MTSRASWVCVLLVVWSVADAFGQTHAINGSIEGVVRDSAGRVVQGAAVAVSNAQTGHARTLTTDADGRFRALLLPPGEYRVTCAHPGFRTASRPDVVVRVGESVRLNMFLEPGAIDEHVTVTAVLPPTRPGQTDTGRTLTASEAQALPLVLRNPLNLVLLTPGVTGTEQDELNQPRLVANGAQMRNAYQLDGSTNTQRDRTGHRLLPLSPVMVGELKVTTSGLAPEFGLASGVVVNVVTPSGTNTWRGLARVDVSRPTFIARPALLPPDAPRPQRRSTAVMLAAGGPLRRDRLHTYAGYHRIRRDASIAPLAIARDEARRLGLDLPLDPQLDRGQTEHFVIAKLDHQITAAHRASYRLAGFFNDSPSVGAGGLVAPDRAQDLFARMATGALQFTSIPGSSSVHELRAQLVRRVTFRRSTDATAGAPSVDIPGIASFGGPYDVLQGADSDFTEGIVQIADAYTRQAGRHTIRAGLDAQWISDRRVNTLRRLYTFPTVDAYLAARSGFDPWAYTRYLQDTGDASIRYRTTFASAFVQDDVRLGSRVSLLYGVRYDVFGTPRARGGQPPFATDWNNLAPRAGLAWSLDRAGRTVVRASVGRAFDPPPLALYEDAIVRGRDGRVRTDLLRPRSVTAPPFPVTAVDLQDPPSIIEVDAGFETQAAWLSHLQLERALGSSAAVSIGWARTHGRHLPVLVDENLRPTGATLLDGRPIYSADVTSATRVDPAYNHVDTIRSTARSRYDAIIVAVRARWDTVSLEASYTGSRSRDNGPLTNVYVQGSQDDRLSDPSNVERDWGATPFAQPHAVVMTIVVVLPPARRGGLAALVGGTTAGVVLSASSGLPANLRSNRDLNGDGQSNDRPLGIARNAGRVGSLVSLDLKAERRLWSVGGLAFSVAASVKNAFNRRNVAQVNRVIATDPDGRPLVAVPDVLPATFMYESRRFEAGIGVRF